MDRDHHCSTPNDDVGEGKLTVLAIVSYRPEEVIEPLEYASVNSTCVTIDSAPTLFGRSVQTLRSTRQAVQKNDPDVIFLDVYETVGVLVVLLSLWYRIPLVCRLVGDQWREYRAPILPAVIQRDIRTMVRRRLSMLLNEVAHWRAIGYVVVSNELKQVVQDRTGCPAEYISVVPVPINVDNRATASEDARRALGIDEERIVLTVTNLKYRAKFKGVCHAIDGLRDVLSVNEEVAYVVAGDGKFLGPLRSYIRSEVPDKRTQNRIYTPGFVNDTDSLYAAADIFLYISFIDGYPNAVIEAQAAGLPVIANAAHGMKDQITTGETGILIDPARPGELTERLQYLLDHPQERIRLGRNARQRVRRENAPEVLGPQLGEALTRVHERAAT